MGAFCSLVSEDDDDDSDAPPFEISIKTLSGHLMVLEVVGRQKTLQLKRQIEDLDPAFPANRVRLMNPAHSGAPLPDEGKIGAYGVRAGVELCMLVLDIEPGTHLRTFGRQGRDACQFDAPRGLAYDSQRERLLVSDTENHRVVAINKRTLHVEWQFGRTGLSGRTNELLNCPSGIALSADGMRVYVADAANSRILMLSALDGAFLLAHGSLGVGDSQLVCPVALAISTRNVLYIADSNAHCVHCLNVRQEPWRPIVQLGSAGKAGPQASRFDTPRGVCVTPKHLFVADSRNHRVQVFDLSNGALIHQIGVSTETRMVRNAPGGVAPTGSMGANGSAGGSGAGQLGGPQGVLVHDGVLYVAEAINGRLSAFDARDPFDFRGHIGTEGFHEGQFRSPLGMAMDEAAGELFVGDEKLHRVSVHKWF